MTTSVSQDPAAPAGWHTLTPRIVVGDPPGLVAFLSHVFGAKGEYDPGSPSILRIGDSNVMISRVGARGPATALLRPGRAPPDGAREAAAQSPARELG